MGEDWKIGRLQRGLEGTMKNGWPQSLILFFGWEMYVPAMMNSIASGEMQNIFTKSTLVIYGVVHTVASCSQIQAGCFRPLVPLVIQTQICVWTCIVYTLYINKRFVHIIICLAMFFKALKSSKYNMHSFPF